MRRADPGSFRDPASHVVIEGDRVLRLLDQRGLDDWTALAGTTFFSTAVGDGRLIATKRLDRPLTGATATLEHPRIPFVSYPYEWTFSMLRDAALLQLDLLEEALGEGIILKDATPFNIQFVEGRPLFIDIGSFERYRAGEPWIGYRQFTRQFLFPLMLRALAGVPFQPWLRGDMEGPSASDMRQILPLGHRLRPKVALHVSLQARMERRMSGQPVRAELQRAGFSGDLIVANVRRLRRLIEDLGWEDGAGQWARYSACDHVGRDREAKTGFLERALERHLPSRVLDLGANDGHFSDVSAATGATVVAVDGDEAVLDSLYRRGTRASIALSDLTNPSPSQGWAGRERPGLFERAAPELVIAYGLIHHLTYTASVPPTEVVDWLAGFGCPVVVEFVSPEDDMVATLSANKTEDELHPGRDRTSFEQLLAGRFDTLDTHELEGATRVLYHLSPWGL